jgi:hypothetical protein
MAPRQVQMHLTFKENTLWEQELSPEAKTQLVELLAQLLREVLQAERTEKEIRHER